MESEQELVCVCGTVCEYENSEWNTVEVGAKIFIFYNEEHHLHRIVGLDLNEEKFILNSLIYKNMVFQKASSFVQWKDVSTSHVYGIKFDGEADADHFSTVIVEIVEALGSDDQPLESKVKADLKLPKRPSSDNFTDQKIFQNEEKQRPQKKEKDSSKMSVLKKMQNSIRIKSKTLKKSDETASSPSSEDMQDLPLLLHQPIEELTSRDLVVKEIFSSEYSYLKQLNILQDVYIDNTRQQAIFTDSEIREIFSNILVIKEFSRSLLEAFKGPLNNWSGTQKIGDVFVKMHQFFKLYNLYCNNYEQALLKVEQAKKRSNVAAFLKQSELSGSPSLISLLITPVQRMPRYLLLLKELLRKTSDTHPDYSDLSAAVTKVSEIVDGLNQNIKKVDQLRRLYDLLRDKQKFYGLEELVAPHRDFVRDLQAEFTLPDGSKSTWLILFSDMLVFVVPGDEQDDFTSRVRERVPLYTLWASFTVPVSSGTLPSSSTASFSKSPRSSVVVRPYLELITPEHTFVYIPNSLNNLNVDDIKSFVDILDTTIDTQLKVCGYSTSTDHKKRKFNYKFGTLSGSDVTSVQLSSLTFKSKPKELPEEPRIMNDITEHALYDGEWLLGRPHGVGILTSDGCMLTGNWENGKMSAKGKAVYNTGRSDQSTYEGEFKDDLPDGYGVMITSHAKYEGQWKKGKRHGEGKMEWTNGCKYQGSWENDQFCGQGELLGPDGSKYNGSFKEGRRSGNGVLASSNGWFYEGGWESDMRQGPGTITYHNGDIFTGNWKLDKRSGKGSLTAGSTVYNGEWENDEFDGQGTLVVKNEYTYEGQWKEGRKSGSGTVTYSSGSKYSGEWRDDRREGQGEWTGPRGERYIGGWHNDKRFGRGKMQDHSCKYDGEFVNDRKEGKGVIFYKNGDQYFGNWKADMRHGLGVLTRANNLGKYEGYWQDDLCHGKGEYKDANGHYDGYWFKDKKNGDGVFKSTNGNIYSGRWKDGRRDGKFIVKRNDTSVATEVEFMDGVIQYSAQKRIPPDFDGPPFL